jgi:DNA-binding CsgD family transcriptional regulator
VNGVAADIVGRWPGLAVRQGRLLLHALERRREFDAALAGIAQARRTGAQRHEGTLVRLDDGRGHLLGLRVCPAPLDDYYQGATAPCAIVYLSELGATLDALCPAGGASLDRYARLFGLTQQEARLAVLLAGGHSLATAAQHMGIAQVAARNYSKKIYAKLGIGGQTELVRLVLRSVGFIA